MSKPYHWKDRARCKKEGEHLDWMSEGYREVTTCMKMCQRCPVQTACFKYARREGFDVGVWGGIPFGRVTRDTGSPLYGAFKIVLARSWERLEMLGVDTDAGK